MNPQRAGRLAHELQRSLSELIRTELKDPRVHMLTITDVEVAPDVSHAKVFVTTLDTAQQRDEMLRGLEHAAGFLRSALSRRLRLRSVPQLHFVYDESVERGTRLAGLIEQAVREDAAHNAPAAPGGEHDHSGSED